MGRDHGRLDTTSCGICVFWRAYGKERERGECRRRAPRNTGRDPWAVTRDEDWCGEGRAYFSSWLNTEGLRRFGAALEVKRFFAQGFADEGFPDTDSVWRLVDWLETGIATWADDCDYHGAKADAEQMRQSLPFYAEELKYLYDIWRGGDRVAPPTRQASPA